MDENIEVNHYQWSNAITWYEESYSCYCDRLPSVFGMNVYDDQTGEVIAFSSSIPEKYFLKKMFFAASPWGRLLS